MSRLADNIIILILSRFLSRFGTIIAGMILVRCFSKADYGSFFQMHLVTNTLVILVVWSIPSSIFYFAPQLKKEHVKGYISQCLLLLLGLGGIAAFAIYLFRNEIFSLINNLALVNYVILVAIILMGKVITEATEPIFITTGRAMFSGYVNVGYIIVLITIYFLLWQLGFGLRAIFITLASCLGLKFLVTLIYVFKLPGRLFTISSPVSPSDRVKYSVPLGLGRITRLVSKRMDQFIIAGFYSPSDFAIYNRGAMELPIISVIIQNISNVLLPNFVSLRKEGRLTDIIDIWHKAIKKVIIVGTGVFLFFLIFSKEFMVVFFTEKYLASTPIFQIYLLSLPFQVTAYGIIHQAFGKIKTIFYINLSIMGVNVVLNIIFFKLFGFLGPAIGTVATTYIFNILHLYIIKDYFKLSFANIYPWRYHFKMLAIGMVGIFPSLGTKFLQMSNLLALIIGLVIFTVLYLGLLLMFHILDEEDKDLIMSWLNPKALKTKFL